MATMLHGSARTTPRIRAELPKTRNKKTSDLHLVPLAGQHMPLRVCQFIDYLQNVVPGIFMALA